VIPPSLSTLAGTWGAVHDSGDLTCMNLILLMARSTSRGLDRKARSKNLNLHQAMRAALLGWIRRAS
jgi:hypothetical protein